MDSPSSTSSSSRLAGIPWAGLLAAALLIAIDTLAFGVRAPWEALAARIPWGFHLEAGIVQDRLALRGLAERARRQPRVVLMGSSRGRWSFVPDSLPPGAQSDLPVARLAHAGIRPFELRSAVDELLGYHPDVLVWVLSEFETHRPLQLDPQASFGGFPSLRDLARETGGAFVLRERRRFYRLGLVALSDSYRFRDVLRRAGLDTLRSFPRTSRLATLRLDTPPALAGGRPLPLPRWKLAQIEQQIEERFGRRIPSEVAQLRSITRGEHARVNLGLLEAGARRLRRAGVELVLAEAPLHPLAGELYDTSIRAEFLSVAQRLARDPGIHFLPLERLGPFSDPDFLDLTHLGPAGRPRFTAGVLDELRKITTDRR